MVASAPCDDAFMPSCPSSFGLPVWRQQTLKFPTSKFPKPKPQSGLVVDRPIVPSCHRHVQGKPRWLGHSIGVVSLPFRCELDGGKLWFSGSVWGYCSLLMCPYSACLGLKGVPKKVLSSLSIAYTCIYDRGRWSLRALWVGRCSKPGTPASPTGA